MIYQIPEQKRWTPNIILLIQFLIHLIKHTTFKKQKNQHIAFETYPIITGGSNTTL